MADSLRPDGDVKRRNQEKCSWCRQKRISCKRDRTQSPLPKCQYCVKKNLPCSRDLRSSEDPGPCRDSEEPGVEDRNTSCNATRYAASHSFDITLTAGTASTARPDTTLTNGRDARFRGLATDQIRERASTTQRELDILQDATAFAKQQNLRPQNCPGQENYTWKNSIHANEERIHALFIDVCDLGLECDRRGLEDLASSILYRLISAGRQSPEIYDGRKRASLSRLLNFFERQRDQGSVKFLLAQIANVSDTSNIALGEEVLRKLAENISETSKTSRQILQDLWQCQYADQPPPNLTLSPQIQATQYCTANIVSAISKYIPLAEEQPSIFGIQSIHFAAANGLAPTLKALTEVFRSLEVRDEFGRTPLFCAAAYGHHDCLQHLLEQGAAPNTRDSHGHTALELAARGGHLECVKSLTDWNAEVNPKLLGQCSSTPLQAAFEGDAVNDKLVCHLLSLGANPYILRGRDFQNAITLAEKREEAAFVGYMQSQTPVDQPPSSDQHKAFALPDPIDSTHYH